MAATARFILPIMRARLPAARARKSALAKMERETSAYLKWLGGSELPDGCDSELVQESESKLDICDAYSEVIFDF